MIDRLVALSEVETVQVGGVFELIFRGFHADSMIQGLNGGCRSRRRAQVLYVRTGHS